MVNRLGGTPKANPDSDQEVKSQPDREKIRQILEIAQKVVHKPKAIIKRIARIIDKPSLNGIARLLSMLLAEYAPETLLKNKHVIRGQKWENTVLQMAKAKIKENGEIS